MNIIIILNYNDYQTTLNYLEQIENYTILDKIVVVDNCSTDDSYLILKEKESKKIDVVQTDENKGYASGNNFGIKYAEEIYAPRNIIISNPDIIVSEYSIKTICDYLDSHNEVASASGLIYDVNGNIAKNSAWKLSTYKYLLIDTFISTSKFYEKILKISRSYNLKEKCQEKEFNAEVLSGCFFAIKDTVLKKIDYFDERTFLYGEETILAYKIKKLNLKQVVLCSEKVIHLQGVTIKKNIKSWRKKNRIILDSRKVYLDNYLKVSKFKKNAFYLLFNIGKYEKYLLINLKQKLMRRIKG
jgi:GT2 family glycosyltransferase